MKNYTFPIIISFCILLGCNKPENVSEIKAMSTSEIFKIKKQSIVFIAGFDEDEDGNNYYANAKSHFKGKQMRIVEDSFSLEEIMEWLSTNNDQGRYDEIHMVSHSNAWRGMSMRTSHDGPRITKKILSEALKKKTLPTLDNRVTKKTQIIFHSCGLGENKELLQLLKTAFSSEQMPQIYASPYFNVFGGRYASHYLANPYYVYYPTAHSKGPKALAKEIERSYPTVNMEWLNAIKNRGETELGTAYSYRFNIPVDWAFTFEKGEAVPELNDREAIMDWIAENEGISIALYEMGIPIEKFRWTSSSSENILNIKGKTTIVCVLQPITNYNDDSEYEIPNINDSQLYTCL